MPWMMPAAIIGSSLIGGAASSSAAGSASDAAQASANAQLQMFNTTNAQQQPWRTAGSNALGQLYPGGSSTLDPQFTHQFNNTDLNSQLAPNYQWQLDTGLGAVKNAANQQTGLLSGNTITGANNWAQNYAGNAYQNAFNNYNSQQTNIFNRLSTIAGYGSTANQTSGGVAGAVSSGIGNSLANVGAAQAAGTMGVGNALSGGLSSLAGWYGTGQTGGTGGTSYQSLAQAYPASTNMTDPAYG